MSSPTLESPVLYGSVVDAFQRAGFLPSKSLSVSFCTNFRTSYAFGNMCSFDVKKCASDL